MKMGLSKMKMLHSAMNAPSEQFQVIHVAGTNGKGSVCLKVAETLRGAGYKTGLFTSPHLFTYRERARVNNEMISVNQVTDILERILYVSENELDIVPSFFEITTMMALEHFSRSNVDVVVLETGLGGRLDCTNIVERPVLTGITNIGFDHVNVLGHTMEEIAREKAGIAKENVDMVLGPNMNAIAEEVIRDHASRCGSKIIDTSRCEISSCVEYDKENIDMAHTMLRVLRESKGFSKLRDCNVTRGLKRLPWCRFEITKLNDVDIVVDAAHNEMGMRALMRGLRNRYPSRTSCMMSFDSITRSRRVYMIRQMTTPFLSRNTGTFRFVIGLSEDKERSTMMKEIDADVVSGLHFTKSSHRRATQVRDLIKDVPSSLRQYVQAAKGSVSVEQTILDAAQRAVLNRDVVVVCGSLYMMGEVSNVLENLEWSEVSDNVVKGASL